MRRPEPALKEAILSGSSLVSRVRGVRKSYRLGKTRVAALNGIDLDIARGQFTVIAGPSGSGKSTLLHLLGALDQPDAGAIDIAGQALAQLSDDERAEFRLRRIGFVFQSFNLLPVLNAVENVEYPMRLTLSNAAQRRVRANELLAAVGLADKGAHRPLELSGGQRQRVAIARALANRPELLLADEPTANLDRATGAEVIALLRKIQRETGTSVVFSSHDPAVLAAADTRVFIVDGRLDHVDAQQEAFQ
jgi:putative ABC transport system ATP-binding protein